MDKVTKRDGRVVQFDKNRIIAAIINAMRQTQKGVDEQLAQKIACKIETVAKNCTVQDIQDMVEHHLMTSSRKDVAVEYIRYRERREMVRRQQSKFMQVVKQKLSASNIQNQNANVDEMSFGGRRGEAANELTRQFALDNILSPMAKENHLNNMIYIHDLDSYATGMHNCLSLPIDDLLKNGFNTRQTDVRPANSINTAFQLLAVLFQLQSLQQFGGVSATHLDWTMVPYVRKSFNKHYIDGIKYVLHLDPEGWQVYRDKSIDSDEYKGYNAAVYIYAMDMTERELKQAVEGMYHNLNTLQSRSGNQLPFTSINYGTCTLPQGRMVIKALLNGSISGVGKLHKTPIFPCSIFQMMNGVNRHLGQPNYDLYLLALESTSKRLYPNYCNVNWSGNAGYDPKDPRTYFSTMGERKLQLM